MNASLPATVIVVDDRFTSPDAFRILTPDCLSDTGFCMLSSMEAEENGNNMLVGAQVLGRFHEKRATDSIRALHAGNQLRE